MQTSERWTGWAGALRRLGLADAAAWLIEAAGPLRLVGAQLLIAGGVFAGKDAVEFADLLEDEQASQAFIELLRADISR